MALMLSLLPIVLILYLMAWRHWSAARAGAAGYLCGVSIAVLFFGANPALLAYAHVKALILSLDVLVIVWGAFLFYKVSDEAGAIAVLGRALPAADPRPRHAGPAHRLGVCVLFAGAGRFRSAGGSHLAAVGGLGLSPMAAVIVPSIGHGWAVTFGSMGAAFQALLATTRLPADQLGPPTAFFLGAACLASGVMIAVYLGGWREARRLTASAADLGRGHGRGPVCSRDHRAMEYRRLRWRAGRPGNHPAGRPVDPDRTIPDSRSDRTRSEHRTGKPHWRFPAAYLDRPVGLCDPGDPDAGSAVNPGASCVFWAGGLSGPVPGDPQQPGDLPDWRLWNAGWRQPEN